MSVTTIYHVKGMTCGHCRHAVTEEVSSLQGVTAVSVDLHPGADSLVEVTSETPLPSQDIAAAIDEAGYELVAS